MFVQALLKHIHIVRTDVLNIEWNKFNGQIRPKKILPSQKCCQFFRDSSFPSQKNFLFLGTDLSVLNKNNNNLSKKKNVLGLSEFPSQKQHFHFVGTEIKIRSKIALFGFFFWRPKKTALKVKFVVVC